MSVADNLFIGREPKRFGLLRRKEMEKRATELMASYGFSLDVREPLNRFSVAMQQIVAICRAIDLSAKVLILDEPTASLDTQEVELLFDLMRQLRDRGVSLIFVTHYDGQPHLLLLPCQCHSTYWRACFYDDYWHPAGGHSCLCQSAL